MFRNHIQQISSSTSIQTGIKNLFQDIENSNEPVKTSKYVRNLGIRNYRYRTQHDAQECLIHILENCYHNNSDGCMFQVAMHESTVCQMINGRDDTGCGNSCAERDALDMDLRLHIEDTEELQTIHGKFMILLMHGMY